MRRRDFIGVLPKVLACAALAPGFVVRETGPFDFDCSMMGDPLPRYILHKFTEMLEKELIFAEFRTETTVAWGFE